jgi:hypothetical protein
MALPAAYLALARGPSPEAHDETFSHTPTVESRIRRFSAGPAGTPPHRVAFRTERRGGVKPGAPRSCMADAVERDAERRDARQDAIPHICGPPSRTSPTYGGGADDKDTIIGCTGWRRGRPPGSRRYRIRTRS